jgi:hypothetical protein
MKLIKLQLQDPWSTFFIEGIFQQKLLSFFSVCYLNKAILVMESYANVLKY